jgi:hypothetical protein
MRLPFRRRPLPIDVPTALKTDYGGQADLGVRRRVATSTQRRAFSLDGPQDDAMPSPNALHLLSGIGYWLFHTDG